MGLLLRSLDALFPIFLQKNHYNKKEIKLDEISISSVSCNYIEKIRAAKDCVFFNALILTLLADVDLRTEFGKMDPRISVYFVLSDPKDEELQRVIKRYWANSDEIFKSFQENFEIWIRNIKNEHANTECDYANLFTPISYFAVDYKDEKESSFIQAKHYLIQGDFGKSPNYIYVAARPGTDLYRYYKQQILLIEKKKGKIACMPEDITDNTL